MASLRRCRQIWVTTYSFWDADRESFFIYWLSKINYEIYQIHQTYLFLAVICHGNCDRFRLARWFSKTSYESCHITRRNCFWQSTVYFPLRGGSQLPAWEVVVNFFHWSWRIKKQFIFHNILSDPILIYLKIKYEEKKNKLMHDWH